LPTLRRVDGYAGAMLLERETSDGVEIIVLTLWRSLDSIRAFAGADLDGAVVADEAAALLTQFDRRVRHYDLVVKDDV
jgi:heme-degrading monooxygenase HmoA